uniref:Uncharacterized protein n=1 Tax=Anopheles atroparvus TaxID=41427 RepID=A0A182IKL8_ANOAO
MLDPDLECGNECGGPGPPPEFLVPPPPRPPFLAELVNCNEEQQQAPFGVASSFGDVDMCEAFPIIDASYHSGPSFQTSAMIALCSVLLLLVIFISSLLVWNTSSSGRTHCWATLRPSRGERAATSRIRLEKASWLAGLAFGNAEPVGGSGW